jgi:hypothetical protein
LWKSTCAATPSTLAAALCTPSAALMLRRLRRLLKADLTFAYVRRGALSAPENAYGSCQLDVYCAYSGRPRIAV